MVSSFKTLICELYKLIEFYSCSESNRQSNKSLLMYMYVLVPALLCVLVIEMSVINVS